MSAATFLLILTAVVIVFVGFLIKSWFELSNASRTKARKNDQNQDQDQESDQ